MWHFACTSRGQSGFDIFPGVVVMSRSLRDGVNWGFAERGSDPSPFRFWAGLMISPKGRCPCSVAVSSHRCSRYAGAALAANLDLPKGTKDFRAGGRQFISIPRDPLSRKLAVAVGDKYAHAVRVPPG